MEKHPETSVWGSGISSFRDNALFQDYHGLESFREVFTLTLMEIASIRFQFFLYFFSSLDRLGIHPKINIIPDLLSNICVCSGHGKFHGANKRAKSQI